MTNPIKDILQNSQPVFLKAIYHQKTKKNMRNWHSQEESKETECNTKLYMDSGLGKKDMI
jgi:hypothetical protein